ncbi:hypothetical protein EW026_g2391 [Hermanssonia centrifuga]|uniref:Uncharacterized protein n=1 Tax=Hermanssonia centrifuga TaxID=98765 RepID=A0A4V3XB06_9APHY|nr:hypothetical protein EW026_g2391 [Hermanssonia centrifuga]
MASYPPQGYAPGYAEPKQSYGTYGGYNVPPPAPVAPVQVVEVQAQPPPKKNRFGGLGNTMANAAAVASLKSVLITLVSSGAAIGGGIVDAIF